MQKIIECVPNFSEGRDQGILREITTAIELVDGVKLLDVDPGKATNRTVVTFVGQPEPVIEAAYQAMKMAASIIDMSKHSGAHPRMGATDVCPLIPISNIDMDEVVTWAHALAKKAGDNLQIPIYLYEYAATRPAWKNLATVRAGEYEALANKLQQEKWKPDYGPAVFNAQAGATAVGARDFLIAYNVNLNTKSTRRANSVAFDVREKGRIKRIGDELNGEIVRDENGEAVRLPGTCKSVKGIGWYIEEYGLAQISMNLTNIKDTSLHLAFEECRKSANQRGLRVTGSELVGLVPLSVILDAGRHFLAQQERSIGVSEEEIIHIAVKSLGLDELGPFDPSKKIIEYQLREDEQHPLINMTLRRFADETASESPAPGGGSIAAYVGVLGASLATMVANLSAHKRGWDDKWMQFSEWAQKGQVVKSRLEVLVDEDTKAFNGIIDAVRMPKSSDVEKSARRSAIARATKYAVEVPYEVMKTAFDIFEVAQAMATDGNPNSVSDAGVGALCARAAIRGAHLNVQINSVGSEDVEILGLIKKADDLAKRAAEKESEILSIVEKVVNNSN